MGKQLMACDGDMAGSEQQGEGTRLWVPKLYYFSFYAAIGALAPFFNIFLQQRGLSGTEIGLIGSLPPLISLAANPFWGAMADRWQIHQKILALCVFVAGLLTICVCLGYRLLAAPAAGHAHDLLSHARAGIGRHRRYGYAGTHKSQLWSSTLVWQHRISCRQLRSGQHHERRQSRRHLLGAWRSPGLWLHSLEFSIADGAPYG